jgi:hypothetical protein
VTADVYAEAPELAIMLVSAALGDDYRTVVNHVYESPTVVHEPLCLDADSDDADWLKRSGERLPFMPPNVGISLGRSRKGARIGTCQTRSNLQTFLALP